MERIARVATRFLTCGDYRQGVARIRCSNPECRREYFRPFYCKGVFLCLSCSQKRTLLFAEYLDEQLLFTLPHRQFVFTLPKALRIFLRDDQRFFAKLSRLIFSLIAEFYSTAAGKPISTAAVAWCTDGPRRIELPIIQAWRWMAGRTSCVCDTR